MNEKYCRSYWKNKNIHKYHALSIVRGIETREIEINVIVLQKNHKYASILRGQVTPNYTNPLHLHCVSSRITFWLHCHITIHYIHFGFFIVFMTISCALSPWDVVTLLVRHAHAYHVTKPLRLFLFVDATLWCCFSPFATIYMCQRKLLMARLCKTMM